MGRRAKTLHPLGRLGHYEGTCVSSSCDYEVAFADTSWNHSELVPDASWARRALDFFGVRKSLITADVLVRDGLIAGKAFAVFVEVPPEDRPNHSFSGYRYTLIGRAETRALSLGGSELQHSIHPEYAVTSPSATGCEAVWVRFTPSADPPDVRRLMDFNLACLTNYKPCREREDLMPSAWRQHLTEMQKEKATAVPPTPSPQLSPNSSDYPH